MSAEPPASLESLLDRPALAAEAVRLMRLPTALSELSKADAQCIVTYMRLLNCPEGGMLLREGEHDNVSDMLVILEGEVTVENIVANRAEPVVVSVLGPGHLIGEMGLLDGGPRTATCTATTPLLGAVLSRNALRRLMLDEPAVASKLLAAMLYRMTQRLRDATRQQRVYHQLLSAMEGEIDELQSQLQKVMDGAARRQHLGDSR
jgi:CRP-like cAMP-binding protein